ncbi:MAG: hypothetical protein HYR55_17515 [Acidobacteria bacterium]|nr:hypothetical protein [Acidobacteriota bacterium]MBI3657084.1 hypothetical protein [Acidobacteriota bacterium]
MRRRQVLGLSVPALKGRPTFNRRYAVYGLNLYENFRQLLSYAFDQASGFPRDS